MRERMPAHPPSLTMPFPFLTLHGTAKNSVNVIKDLAALSIAGLQDSR